VELEQVNLFAPKKEIAPYLKGKTFVVFDLETTGTSPAFDKIIEIAAFKIVDGVIKEVFSTFVNPGIGIPPRITELTSITDEDVANAPRIEDVLPDFQKFVDGVILVGHNIGGFDIPFINNAGEPLHIRFDNPYEDTYPLSKTYLKGLKNNKLGTVASHFGIVNEHAHRADSDTLTNAKVFLKLAEYMS
jgi:DNA polymerase-3 subunit alpha (Gram-positive type)